MLNLGDGPYNSFHANQQQIELDMAGITYNTEFYQIEVIDPKSDVGKMAQGGIYVVEAIRKAPKIMVDRYKVEGNLVGWKFTRDWYYWTAECIIPSAQITNPDAMDLWINYGKELRVAGHAGCVKPEPPWLKNRFSVIELEDQEAVQISKRLYDVYHDDKKLTTTRFDEVYRYIEIVKRDLPSEEAYGGVDLYHIDTQKALNAFSAYLKTRP